MSVWRTGVERSCLWALTQAKNNEVKTAEGLGGVNIHGTSDKKTQHDVGKESGRGERAGSFGSAALNAEDATAS